MNKIEFNLNITLKELKSLQKKPICPSAVITVNPRFGLLLLVRISIMQQLL